MHKIGISLLLLFSFFLMLLSKEMKVSITLAALPPACKKSKSPADFLAASTGLD
jgi:hypothetical protein